MPNVNYYPMAIALASLRIASVVGARPQFVKLAPIHHELVRQGIRHDIVHSGQHYDERMSDQFFLDLELPSPVINLDVGSGSHTTQTAHIMEKLDDALESLKPDVVLIFGDTNTTLAGALVVSKRTEYLVHIEAGLRSFNHSMPEEINRIVADHLSHLLLAPTQTALERLKVEGLANRARFGGDVMVDVLRQTETRVLSQPPRMPEGWDSSRPYIFATLHRAENTDDPNRLRLLIDRLSKTHSDVRLAVHPRLRARLGEYKIMPHGGVTLWEPLSYPQTISAVIGAEVVVTDSGGLQKEAALLGTPCITTRFETEWVETVNAGWNILDPHLEVSVDEWAAEPRTPIGDVVLGDGHAAKRIVGTVLNEFRRPSERE